MQLREFDYSSIQTVRKRCIHYANDGNTVVKHWRELYPLESITGYRDFAGLYLEYVKEDYSEFFRVYNDLGNDCIEYGYLSSWYGVTEEAVTALKGYATFIGLNGYKRKLEQMEMRGAWINNAMIRGLADAGELELAEHYRVYHETQLQTRDEEILARQKELEQEEQQRELERQARLEEQVRVAEKCILERKELVNDPYDGSTIILHLMKKHGIIPPLRTQGWINEKLAKVTAHDNSISYSFRKTKGGKASQTAVDCLFQLRDRIDQVYSESQAA